MTVLIIGLIIFLGVHSVRIFAEDWRVAQIKRRGDGVWKGVYTLLSIAGFGLVVWGFGLARQQPVMLWTPPAGMRHAASLLTLVAFVLLAAAYVPKNAFKARMHHPMVLSVKTWAFAHLIANGSLADVVLFGAFLAWSVACFIAARKRDRAAGTRYAAGTALGTVITIVVGAAAWAGFAFWGHGALIGVRPFG